jgi:uncharacterized membrane protein
MTLTTTATLTTSATLTTGDLITYTTEVYSYATGRYENDEIVAVFVALDDTTGIVSCVATSDTSYVRTVTLSACKVYTGEVDNDSVRLALTTALREAQQTTQEATRELSAMGKRYALIKEQSDTMRAEVIAVALEVKREYAMCDEGFMNKMSRLGFDEDDFTQEVTHTVTLSVTVDAPFGRTDGESYVEGYGYAPTVVREIVDSVSCAGSVTLTDYSEDTNN